MKDKRNKKQHKGKPLIFGLLLIFLFPFTSFGATTGTLDIQDCYQYGVDYPAYTINGSGSTQQQIQILFDSGYTPNSGEFRYVLSGSLPATGNLNWSNAYDGLSARPWHAWRYKFYTDGDGFSSYIDTDFIVQDGECTDPEPEPPTVATSTATMGDIALGLAILIAIASFSVIFMIYNSLNKYKPWK